MFEIISLNFYKLWKNLKKINIQSRGALSMELFAYKIGTGVINPSSEGYILPKNMLEKDIISEVQ